MSTDTFSESKTKLRLLLVGDADREEFAAARDEMQAVAAVTSAREISEAIRLVNTDGCRPDVIVLAQAIPGEFSIQAVESLRRAAPLARMVGLLGTWCEGEMRTGDPWPGVIRLYWYQWHPHARMHLEALAEGRPTAWALPATATHEDRLLEQAKIAAARTPGGFRGCVAVFSPRPEMTEWICEAFEAPEWEVLPADFRRVQEFLEVDPKTCLALSGHVDLLVYDATEFDDAEAARFDRVCGLIGAKHSIILCDFPRLADRRRAAASGTACMLAKPVEILDLTQVAVQLIPPGAPISERAAV